MDRQRQVLAAQLRSEPHPGRVPGEVERYRLIERPAGAGLRQQFLVCAAVEGVEPEAVAEKIDLAAGDVVAEFLAEQAVAGIVLAYDPDEMQEEAVDVGFPAAVTLRD